MDSGVNNEVTTKEILGYRYILRIVNICSEKRVHGIYHDRIRAEQALRRILGSGVCSWIEVEPIYEWTDDDIPF